MVAELIPLTPAVSRTWRTVEFIATMAGHDATGLLLTIRIQNGHVGVVGVVHMDDEGDVRSMAAKAQQRLQDSALTVEIAEAELRELVLPAEGAYRTALAGARYGRRRGGAEEEGPEPQPWPDPLDERAWYGLAGEIARAIEPHTEAAPAAVLVTTLLFLGNAMGHTPHARVAGGRHTANEFAVIVGPSAKGRKGSSIGHPRSLMRLIDPVWEERRYLSGLSSGEGLIANVRDPVMGKDGAVVDAGETDKRLMVVEEEFASVLKVMVRESNTLSTALRQAWDSGDMGVMTRQNPLRARGAHISILGHATKQDLQKYLSDTEAWNGFANRFLWICARRSERRLPRGDTLPTFGSLVRSAHTALEFARARDHPVPWGEEAGDTWDRVYPLLSEEKPGRLAAATGRAEAHILRLALLYALLDLCDQIELPHLQAAFAIWRYAEQSAAWLFGDDSLEEEIAEMIEALDGAGSDGLNRRALFAATNGHMAAAKLDAVLDQLMSDGRVVARHKSAGEKGGRPGNVYILAQHAN